MSKLARPIAAVAGAIALVAVAFFAVFHDHHITPPAPKPAIVAVAKVVPAPSTPAVAVPASPAPVRPAPALVDTTSGWRAAIEKLKRPAFLAKPARERVEPAAKPAPLPVPRPVSAKSEPRRHYPRRAPVKPAPAAPLSDAAYGPMPWCLDGFLGKLLGR